MSSCPNSLLRFPYVFHAFLQRNLWHKSPPFSNTRSSAQTILVPFSLGAWILGNATVLVRTPPDVAPVGLRMLHWLQNLNSSTGHSCPLSFGFFIASICLDCFFTKLSPLTFGVWILPRCQAEPFDSFGVAMLSHLFPSLFSGPGGNRTPTVAQLPSATCRRKNFKHDTLITT